MMTGLSDICTKLVALASLCLLGAVGLRSIVHADEAVSFPGARRGLKETMFDEERGFEDLFPLEITDYIGFFCAVAGLVIAAGGGIGGGGMLVPIYILLLEFPVKRR